MPSYDHRDGQMSPAEPEQYFGVFFQKSYCADGVTEGARFPKIPRWPPIHLTENCALLTLILDVNLRCYRDNGGLFSGKLYCNVRERDFED